MVLFSQCKVSGPNCEPKSHEGMFISKAETRLHLAKTVAPGVVVIEEDDLTCIFLRLVKDIGRRTNVRRIAPIQSDIRIPPVHFACIDWANDSNTRREAAKRSVDIFMLVGLVVGEIAGFEIMLSMFLMGVF